MCPLKGTGAQQSGDIVTNQISLKLIQKEIKLQSKVKDEATLYQLKRTNVATVLGNYMQSVLVKDPFWH